MHPFACIVLASTFSQVYSQETTAETTSTSSAKFECEEDADTPTFFSKCATGDLTKPVTEDTSCLVTGEAPISFTSQAPQYCLAVSGAQRERCCTPSHDVHIKQAIQDLWPGECAGDEYPSLETLACFVCSKDQP